MGKRALIYGLFVFCLQLTASPNFCRVSDFQGPPGKLSKVHSGLNDGKNCTQCHTTEKKVDPAKCLGCHKELALRIKAGRGYHKDKTGDCSTCHQEHNGEDYELVQWDPEEFDHAETGYLLTGMHLKVKACDRCHTPKNAPQRKYCQTYLIKDNRCSACHNDPHGGITPIAPIVTPQRIGESIYGKYKENAIDEIMAGFDLLPVLLVLYGSRDQ